MLRFRSTNMLNPDKEVVFIEDGKVTEWPTFGMTALRLMTVFPDPETGEDIHPTEYDMALARALVTGDWDILRQFDDLTAEEKIGASAETILWYDINAPEYTKRITNTVSTDQVKEFTDRIPTGGSILDAGSGGGRDSEYFASMGYRPVGIDLSNGMIASAKNAHPDNKFVQANFTKVPFPSSTFDGLWVHASIHHLGTIEDVEGSLNEFYRVLKSAGAIHIASQAKTGSKETMIVADRLSGHNRFYRYFTATQLYQLMKNAGFINIQITRHKETDDKVSTGREDVEWLIALADKY